MKVGYIITLVSHLLTETNLVATQQNFCKESFCYSTDGQLHGITNSQEVQDYCSSKIDGSWPLEIYDSDIYWLIYDKIPYNKSVFLNAYGTNSTDWIGISDQKLSGGLAVVNSSNGDYLYVFKSAGQLLFGTGNSHNNYNGICQYPGCGDRCYFLANKAPWFYSEYLCSLNNKVQYKSSPLDGYHLATFDGLSVDQVQLLQIVQSLPENISYWIGYSTVQYYWKHSKSRMRLTPFERNMPMFTRSQSYDYMVAMKYAHFYEQRTEATSSFVLVCMKENQTITTLSATSESSNQTPNPLDESKMAKPDFIWIVVVVLAFYAALAIVLTVCLTRRAFRKQEEDEKELI